jgi:hypothetical protein
MKRTNAHLGDDQYPPGRDGVSITWSGRFVYASSIINDLHLSVAEHAEIIAAIRKGQQRSIDLAIEPSNVPSAPCIKPETCIKFLERTTGRAVWSGLPS